MAKILITGSTGFIGKALLIKLKASHHETLELNHSSGDISDESTWAGIPKADVVVHLAARTFVPGSWTNLQGYLQTNLLGTVCALNYCKEQDAKMIFLSSYLYGKPESLPIPESAPIHAFNPYALSKKLAEEVCQFYTERFMIHTTILRPFNVYGPGQHEDFVIPLIIKQALSGSVIQVQDLEPKRDYVYIDDVIDFISAAVDLDQKFNVFNVGTGISYSVAEIIDMVQKHLGTNLPVKSMGGRRPEEIMDTQADISRALVLGWEPKWTLQQGIAEVLSDIQNKKEKI